MRVILQRSKQASFTVDGQVTGVIQKGYVLLVGITHSDTEEDIKYVAKKITDLRIWEDEDGKMNRSIAEAGGDTRKGKRPSFVEAAKPEQAKPLWEAFNEQLKANGLHVETGVFGAMMDVALINDGPVTITIESKGK